MKFTALFLTPESRQLLLQNFPIPEYWEIFCDHMTINMGAAITGPASELLGQNGTVTVVGFASDEKVMAVSVESDIPSVNKIKHITLAVQRALGGKPHLSNKLENWNRISIPFELTGIIREC